MEMYRSGHNEAVLKTVWCNSHVGSNPTVSAMETLEIIEFQGFFVIKIPSNFDVKSLQPRLFFVATKVKIFEI